MFLSSLLMDINIQRTLSSFIREDIRGRFQLGFREWMLLKPLIKKPEAEQEPRVFWLVLKTWITHRRARSVP
jgi:hypothetical protein